MPNCRSCIAGLFWGVPACSWVGRQKVWGNVKKYGLASKGLDGNIFIRTDPAGTIKPDKEKSTEKIDAVGATIMGLDRAIRCGSEPATESVYDRRGIFFM